MKTRLPKLLLAALMAAIGSSGIKAQAETITGHHATDSYVKVTESLNIGDGTTDTSYIVQGEASGEVEAFLVTNGATVTVDNANFQGIPEDSQLGIGDGTDGTMIVKNGSKVNLDYGGTVYLGYNSTGVLTVEGATTEFIGGYNNLWMYGTSTINVKDSATVSVCATDKSTSDKVRFNYRVLLGLSSEGTSNINISNGGSFTSSASQFVTNFASNSVVNISVDGEGSSFTQSAETVDSHHYPMGTSGEWVEKTPGVDIPEERNPGWYDKDSTAGSVVSGKGQTITYLCDSGTDKNGLKYAPQHDCTTNISATNGGIVTFDSTLTYIGSFLDKEKGYNTDKHANLTIGADSSMSFKRMEIYADTNITNSGTFSATDVVVHDGAKLTFNMTPEGVVLMEADKLVIKEGGALIIQQAEDVAPALMFGLQDAVTAQLDADLTLESGSVFTLNLGAVDLNGHALTIEDGAVINTVDVTDGDGDGKLTLFTNFTGAQRESYNVVLNGVQTQITYDSTTGNITTGAIPEPTTATLSLLALAALAARRRRH